MRPIPQIRVLLFTTGIITWCSLCVGMPPYMEEAFEPGLVLGIEQCQKCHEEQVRVLKQHAHFTHARPLQRNPQAISMAKALGGRSVKRSDRCIRCHYTTQSSDRGLKAISAVSCESCHGPSKDWLLMHNDYGGPDATKESESIEHRVERITTSIQNGMRHPAHLYTLARRCFSCHVVDDEELVNVAGHTVRSKEFNMVSWSQGNMRHNFLRTGGNFNATSDPVRLRTMYVVSLLSDLEHSLLALAKASMEGPYRSVQEVGCQKARQQIASVQQRLNDHRLAAVLNKTEGLSLDPKNRDQLTEVANHASRIAWEFSLQPGGDLAEIETLLPDKSTYVGSPVR